MIEISRYDLEYLQLGIEELEDYLLSDELFWPVSGRPTGGKPFFLKMTIGNLLLSVRRLEALAGQNLISPEEGRELLSFQRKIEAVRTKWQVAWENKAGEEYQVRINQWTRALNELKGDRYQNAPYYRNEVRVRVLLALLADFVPEEDRASLAEFDRLLRGMFKSGEFIWQEELAPGFPLDKFWYLYGGV